MNLDASNLLKVEHLKKYYPIRRKSFLGKPQYVKSVDDVSFSVKEGSILGLVGESGCGKSTIGKTILNLVPATAGKVIFQNQMIYDVENKIRIPSAEMTNLRSKMQIILQDPYASLNPRKNVENIVSEGIRKHQRLSRKDRKEKVEEILALCGMDATVLHRYPHEFSGGQRQRISIARCLVMNPEFVICDEPTAALDVSIQSQILNLMLDMKEEFALTYLFISHNFSIVKSFCDEIAVMYLGEIVEFGKADEIYHHPKHPYTQALISSVPKQHPSEEKERIHLIGSMPSAVDIKKGCRFYTRCPYRKKCCKDLKPELNVLEDGSKVACHLYTN